MNIITLKSFLYYRYVPSSLFLAIQELDEKHVGTFSFRTRDGFLKVRYGTQLDPLSGEVLNNFNCYFWQNFDT